MASPPSLLSSDWVRARLYHLLAPFLALAIMAVFEQTWLGQLLENESVNVRFRVRAPFDPPADQRLVFVGIDQQSLDKFGRYPWPRTVMADFLTNLAKANVNPHTVAFDILYTEPSANPADDTALANAAGLLPSVISGALSVDVDHLRSQAVIQADEQKTAEDLAHRGLTSSFETINGDASKIRGSSIATLPIAPLRDQSFFGFVNDEPSPVDYIRHTIPLLIRVNDKVFPSLALQILCQSLHVDADKVVVNVGQDVVLKNSSGKIWTIPINKRGEYTINYRSNRSFENNNISFGKFASALDDHLNKGADLPIHAEQKTLLIGETEVGLTDLGPTPVEAQSPLPYTHLNVINNVLQNDYLRFVPWYLVVIGWALFTWPTLLRLKEAHLVEAVCVPIGIIILYHIFAFAIFWKWSLQIALTWPVISYGTLNFGGVVLRWREEQRGREQIKQLFSRMLSPEVMHHLLAHPENEKLGGSERLVTIMFSDIRDYTKFSEGLAAGELVRQLNVYFERMVDCVKVSQGTLHKYIGDAIMAAWGDIAIASQGPKKDAQNAVRSALMMRHRLRMLNEERKTANLIPLRIGIGLNHGDVLVGLIGASSRSEFTVMGDAVNTASRLEGLTKEFHTDLAISESVCDLLEGGFLVRRLGLIVLKGKTKPTVVYEVLAEKTSPGDSKLPVEMVTRYEQAFDDFLARRFAEAEAGFLACETMHPNDHCVSEYLKASRKFLAEPPPADWDGRIVMTTK
jgi:adenylate cyclase